MPRQARIDYPGALHHVIGRGIERSPIFKTDKNKAEFVKRLKDSLSKSDLHCYAWSVMDTHFHIFVERGATPLSEFMRGLLTGYAVYYNRTYKRTGYVFQNRYKSIVCDKDEYFLTLIRYIHLNPVKAKIISFKSLGNYKWTGHSELMGSNEKGIIEKDEVLGYFGKTEQGAVQEYDAYIKEGVESKEDYEGGGLLRSAGGLSVLMAGGSKEREMHDDRVLGDGQFVEEALSHLQEIEEIEQKLKGIDDLINKLGRYYGIEQNVLMRSRVKEAQEARSMFVYLGNAYLGEKITELGKVLGISQTAASMARKRGREIEVEKRVVEKIIN